MKNETLTRQLFTRITPIILGVVAMIGLLAFYSSQREINHVYDTQLINNANVLWTLVQEEFSENDPNLAAKIGQHMVDDDDNEPLLDRDVDDYGEARMFRIWQNKTIVMMSDTAFSKDIPYQAPGFSDVVYHDETWRVFTMIVPRTNVRIEVGEKLSLRNALVRHILVDLFLPLLILIPLIGAALWYGITRGLNVIRALVKQIQSRSPDDLSPIGVQSLPRDLAPLGHSINRLFVKLTHSISSERRFADHAAHQLRTPLAGSKLLIQMLSTADEAEKQAILHDLAESNERATQLVGKLLVAARVSHQPITLRAVNLYDTLARVIAEMAPLIAQKRLTLSLEGDEHGDVYADETLLALMMANLIENAVKYTPAEGHIEVQVSTHNEHWRCSIRDSGPGIPDNEKPLVFERFYRIESPDIEGVGLGLSIVTEIAERLNGNITLATPADGIGLEVQVLLPKAAADAQT